MRDLLFKNLTSESKKRKIIASSEVFDKQGAHTVINRHFICLVKAVKDGESPRLSPYVYVVKEHKTKEQTERFFCKIKGSLATVINEKPFLIFFMHTLKIKISANNIQKHYYSPS